MAPNTYCIFVPFCYYICMGKFTESLDAALEWTGTVLFRPFVFKKWLFLGLAAYLAGALVGGGTNLRIPSNSFSPGKAPITQAKAVTPAPKPQDVIPQIKAAVKKHLALIILAAAFLFLLLVVSMWIAARFAFVFIDDIVHNDASIRAPFRAHKAPGDSYFKFSLVFLTCCCALMGIDIAGCVRALSARGVFVHPQAVGFGRIMLACLPYIGALFVFFIILGVIGFIIHNFVLLVMYKDRCGFIEGWSRAWGVIAAHASDTVVFAFLLFCVGVAASFVFGIVTLVVYIGLLGPMVGIGGILYGIYRIIPAGMHLVFWVLLVGLGVPVLVIISYCGMCIYLPCAVFLRTLSIKFLARLDSRYDCMAGEKTT